MTVLAGQRLTTQFWQDNTQRTIPGGYASNPANTSTGTTAAPTSGAEIVFTSTGSVTLRNGRAYRFTVSALIQTSSTDKARIFIKRTGLAGTVLLDTQHLASDLVGSNSRKSFQNEATNQTGADLVGVVVATIQRSSSSGTPAAVIASASATSPAYLQIEDIGPATDYPSATAIS